MQDPFGHLYSLKLIQYVTIASVLGVAAALCSDLKPCIRIRAGNPSVLQIQKCQQFCSVT